MDETKPKEIIKEHEKQMRLERIEADTRDKFSKSLERIEALSKENVETDEQIIKLIPAFKAYTQFIDLLFTSTYTKGAIVYGDAGIGKSRHILKTLHAKKANFALFNTYTTPLALYELLYKNNGKIIILDDISQLLKDKKSVAILKAALFNPTGERLITYSSTTKVLEDKEIPPSFIFSGSIVIILNELSKSLKESFQALLSRVYLHKIELTLEEKVLLNRIIFFNTNIYNLTSVQKHEVLTELEKLVSFSNSHRYNVRTAIKCAEIYKSFNCDLNECRNLFHSILETDSKLRKFLTIEEEGIHRGLPVEKRVEVFKKYTGYSRREYFNIKSQYYKSKNGQVAAIEKETEEIKSLMNNLEG